MTAPSSPLLVLLLLAAAPSAGVSLSRSSVATPAAFGGRAGRAGPGPGAAVSTPALRVGTSPALDCRFAPPRIGIGCRALPSPPPPPSSSSTALAMALGGSYLEDMGPPEGGDRWGIFGGGRKAGARGTNRDGGSTTGFGGGTDRRAATGGDDASKSFGIGGNRRGGGGRGGGGGNPRVFPIRQPQDLLDFVIRDERLSVVKVYASWCKTCAVFDVRYNKLASELGDAPATAGGSEPKKGRVRFAEMQFDDPNNEEMCRLLNATKLPYILMYKGSKGKVADFQCGPAKFQMLLDAVEEHADPEGSAVLQGGDVVGGLEWRAASGPPQAAAARYGSSGAVPGDLLKEKEDEIARLYAELSALRADFDRRIVLLKKEHASERATLNERIRAQTEDFDNERRALAKQIEDLSQEMMEQGKSQNSDRAESERLRGDIKEKEEEYKKTLTALNLRITELEQDLFKSRNELRYNSDASSNDQRRLQEHISKLDSEIAKLTERNKELKRELIEEKRVVVASTEEAARVLKQLEKIKKNEDEERKELAARIVELEGLIEQRESQLLNIANGGDLANEIQAELDQLKKEHGEESLLMQSRISELEQQLSYYSNNESDLASQQQRQQQQQQELEKESKALSDRILELENEIDERDRLLRTSNKATDILLDNMEAQKRDYEMELERTSGLVSELEEAIAARESEMVVLRKRMEGLERQMVEANEWRRREEETQAAPLPEPSGREMYTGGGEDVGSLNQERQARIAAEREVGKLMGYLKDKEEEISRMQQQQQQGGGSGAQASGWFGDFGALFNGGVGANAELNADANGGYNWYEAMMNGENNDEMQSYEMLKDVIMEDEISPTRTGVGRSENIWEGAARPNGMPGQAENVREGAGRISNAAPSGVGRSENIWEGAQIPTPATPSPAATGQPTPAMAFERRLAENPIVPAGAFGGSKPTASFFSPKSSGGMAAPSDTPDYYQNVINNFDNREPSRREVAQPAMPPAASYQQRPTAPSPRVAAPKMTENIYAGAGSASQNIPTPAPREEQVQVPTPQMEFERRLAENPIVPAGAFGGSAPTAHFFSPKSSPGAPASLSTGTPAAPASFGSTSGGGRDNYRTQQSYTPEDEDSQSKWQRLDDNEKKRVAAEAYKAFEKSLEDRRGTALKPKAGSMGRGGAGRTGGGSGALKGGSGGAGAARTVAVSKQVEPRRKRQTAAAKKETGALPPEKKAQQQQSASAPKQSAQQIRAAAAQASAKRMSLAEMAAKAEQNRKKEELRVKAEVRKAQEAKQMENFRLEEEEKRRKEANKNREEAKQNGEIRRAEELKRKAEADLALAAEAKAKADAIEAAKQPQSRPAVKEQRLQGGPAKQDAQVQVAESDVGSLDPTEMIEAALLGAEESRAWKVPKKQEQKKKKTKVAAVSRTRVTAGSGFALSKKNDVAIMKDSMNGDADAPQLLEGSLKDLLKRGPSTPKRNSGDLNY